MKWGGPVFIKTDAIHTAGHVYNCLVSGAHSNKIRDIDFLDCFVLGKAILLFVYSCT